MSVLKSPKVKIVHRKSFLQRRSRRRLRVGSFRLRVVCKGRVLLSFRLLLSRLISLTLKAILKFRFRFFNFIVFTLSCLKDIFQINIFIISFLFQHSRWTQCLLQNSLWFCIYISTFMIHFHNIISLWSWHYLLSLNFQLLLLAIFTMSS